MNGNENGTARNRRVWTIGVVLAASVLVSAGLSLARSPAAGAQQTSTGDRWTKVPSTLVYVDHNEYRAFKVTRDEVDTIRLPYDGEDEASWTVSPNGKQLSVVDADGLRVGKLGTQKPPLVIDEPGALCDTQAWSPDSTRLLVIDCGGADHTLRSVDVSSGEVTTLFGDPRLNDVKWTADGEHIVWGTTGTNGDLTFSKPGGGEARDFFVQNHQDKTGIPTVSANGKIACVRNIDEGEDINSVACGSPVYTKTGAHIPNHSDGELGLAMTTFLSPGGDWLIRWWDDNGDYHVDIANPTWDVVDEFVEPYANSDLQEAELRSYTN